MNYEHFVITGIGRSGTQYAAKLFSKLGLSCGHQQVFLAEFTENQKPNWGGHVGDSSGHAAPFVTFFPRNCLVIHQVRNPLKVVASLKTARHIPGQSQDPGIALYEKHVPGVANYEDLIERGAYLWVMWNELVENISDRENYLFVRLESYGPEFLKKVLGYFEREWLSEYEDIFERDIPKDVGTTKHAPGYEKIVSFDGLSEPLRSLVHQKMKQYGYEP